jgi:hypothetical protein
MAKHSDGCSYPKRLALLGALFLPFGAVAVVSDTASAQLWQQQQNQQQHAQIIRRSATRINPPERTNPTPRNANSGAA